MRRVLTLLPLLFVLSCGISQDELEGIDGIWTLDSISCFNSIGDASTIEIWAVSGTTSSLTLGITGRDISMTGDRTGVCASVDYSLQYLFTERTGLREGKLDYTVLTKNPQVCSIELDYFDGSSINPALKYDFDLIPVANNLYNNYFQRVDEQTLLLELPGAISGSGPLTTSGDQGCGANCECYGAFVK
jgi:hypothetical protein